MRALSMRNDEQTTGGTVFGVPYARLWGHPIGSQLIVAPAEAGAWLFLRRTTFRVLRNSSRPYFLRVLRVKHAVLGSREVREGKKSAKGLRYLIAERLEEAQPRVSDPPGAGATMTLCRLSMATVCSPHDAKLLESQQNHSSLATRQYGIGNCLFTQCSIYVPMCE